MLSSPELTHLQNPDLPTNLKTDLFQITTIIHHLSKQQHHIGVLPPHQQQDQHHPSDTDRCPQPSRHPDLHAQVTPVNRITHPIQKTASLFPPNSTQLHAMETSHKSQPSSPSAPPQISAHRSKASIKLSNPPKTATSPP